MKKIIVLLLLVPALVLGAAQGTSRPKSYSKSSREAVAFAPADVIITAIVNLAHNPVTVVNARGFKKDGDKLRSVSCTIPSRKSTADESVCDKRLHILLPYKPESRDNKLNDLTGFHITTGHGTYTFANSQFEVAAYQLNKSGSEIEKRKALLAPWKEERKAELVIGHDGKLELRLPGSLTDKVRSEKSKPVGKK